MFMRDVHIKSSCHCIKVFYIDMYFMNYLFQLWTSLIAIITQFVMYVKLNQHLCLHMCEKSENRINSLVILDQNIDR